jgi:hypothetical protein
MWRHGERTYELAGLGVGQRLEALSTDARRWMRRAPRSSSLPASGHPPDATIPVDRDEERSQTRRQLAVAVMQRREAERDLAEAEAVAEQAARRRWGRRDQTGMTTAGQHMERQRQQLQQTVAAQSDLKDRFSELVEHQHDRNQVLTQARPRRVELAGALSEFDGALDRTRPGRVQALTEARAEHLVDLLGAPPTTPPTGWCGNTWPTWSKPTSINNNPHPPGTSSDPTSDKPAGSSPIKPPQPTPHRCRRNRHPANSPPSKRSPCTDKPSNSKRTPKRSPAAHPHPTSGSDRPRSGDEPVSGQNCRARTGPDAVREGGIRRSSGRSFDGESPPSDVLLVQDFGQDTACGLGRKPQRGPQDLSHGHRFEVQQVEPGMPGGDSGHCRHGPARIGERDVVAKLEQAQDRLLLFSRVQLFEWPRQVPTRPEHGGSTRPVVPVDGRVQLNPGFGQADEELFDQQPVVEDHRPGSRSQLRRLLIGQVGVVDGGEPLGVATLEDPAELPASDLHAAGDDQGGVAEIDEADLSALVDTPPVSQVGRQAGLAALGNPGIRRPWHDRIVPGFVLQGARTAGVPGLYSGWSKPPTDDRPSLT